MAVIPKSQLPRTAAGHPSLDIQPQHVGGYAPRGVMQQPTKSGDLRPIRFGVTHRALIQRINRVLKASNKQPKAVRGMNPGRYYVITRNCKFVTSTNVDLKTVGRELGVLGSHEKLIDEG